MRFVVTRYLLYGQVMDTTAEGWNGKVRLSNDRLSIERFTPKFTIGAASRGELVLNVTPDLMLRFSEASAKSIRISGARGAGFLSVATGGAPLIDSPTSGDALSHPTTVLFEKSANDDFRKLRDTILQVQEGLKRPIGDAVSHLKGLSELLEQGVINSDEFQKAKEQLLGSPPDKTEQAVSLIKQLHSLHKAGALSESEFRTKKWDILSKS